MALREELGSLRLYQGSVSSASTGKFAALRLPFDAAEEKAMSLDSGTSMSIPSSTSDIFVGWVVEAS